MIVSEEEERETNFTEAPFLFLTGLLSWEVRYIPPGLHPISVSILWRYQQAMAKVLFLVEEREKQGPRRCSGDGGSFPELGLKALLSPSSDHVFEITKQRRRSNALDHRSELPK